MGDEQISLRNNNREIEIDGTGVLLPFSIREHTIFNNLVIALFHTYTADVSPKYDIDPPPRRQNIIGISKSGEKAWEVSEPPKGADDTVDDPRYTAIDDLTGRVLATHRNGRRYEINPDDGTIAAEFEESELPIGSTVVEIEAGIDGFLELDDLVVVHADRSTEGGNIFGFGLDGTQRWQSDKTVGGGIYQKDGQLWVKESAGPRHSEKFPIDTDTGEIGEGEMFLG